MTEADICEPEPKKVSDRRFNQPSMTQLMKGAFTDSHTDGLAILSAENVHYLAEEVIRIWNVFDSKARPVNYKADVLIDDPRFGSGVIHIDVNLVARAHRDRVGRLHNPGLAGARVLRRRERPTYSKHEVARLPGRTCWSIQTY